VVNDNIAAANSRVRTSLSYYDSLFFTVHQTSTLVSTGSTYIVNALVGLSRDRRPKANRSKATYWYSVRR